MNYLGQEDVGGRPAWKFQNPAGESALIDDPLQALELGAPVFGQPAAPPVVPGLAERGALAQNNSQSADPTRELADAGVNLSALTSGAPQTVSNPVQPEPMAPDGGVVLRPRGEGQAPVGPEMSPGAAYQRQQAEMVASNRLPPGYRMSGGRAGRPEQWMATQRSGVTLTGDPARDEDMLQGREDRIEDTGARREEAVKLATAERLGAVNNILKENIREAADLGIEEARLSALATKREDAMKTRWASVEEAQREAENLKVDPRRYWNDKSAGEKIGLSIAMALGAIGSSMTGGPNHAMQLINDFAERDTQAQLAALEQKKDAATGERSRFAEWMRTNDPEIAREQSRAAKLGYSEAVARAMLGKQEYANIHAGLVETLPLIQAEKNQALENVRNGFSKQLGEQFLPEIKAIRGGLVRAPLTAEQAANEMKTNEMIGKGLDAGSAVPEGAMPIFDPKTGKEIGRLDEKSAAKVRDKLILDRSTINHLNKLKSMANKWSSMNPDQRAAAATQAAVVGQKVWTGVMGRTDAPSEVESSGIQEMTSNPLEFFSNVDRANARIDTMIQGQITDSRSNLRAHGLNPGAVDYTSSPETEVE